MRPLTLLIIIPVLFGCATNSIPKQPEVVEVVVERYRPLPAWAKTERPLPTLADQSVKSHLKREDASLGENELANCHRRLLQQLDENKVVNPRDCDPEK